jgi:uroporphyrinogen decarboxylase
MTKREVVRAVYRGEKPPYVPWSFGFTHEARQALLGHFGDNETLDAFQNDHFAGTGVGWFERLENARVRDPFGVVWDRSVDKDIGVVENQVLPDPSLRGYQWPDPLDERWFPDVAKAVQNAPDRFRIFAISFSLYERAWTMRGMEQLMFDFIDEPAFVHDLLAAIADYNLVQVREALKHDVDAVYFGDDWGSQHGLIMGPDIWREFIKPQLERMYGAVREADTFVHIHSCGDVDELFDDLVEIGLDCFNPFQPEVMDVEALLPAYRGRLAFHGGLSTQQTLPYGTAEEVRAETRKLLELGSEGGYVFGPAHAVEGDVPMENMLAFMEEVREQPGAPR